MKGAEHYMVRNPNQDKPTGPVVAAEHKASAKNRDQADETHPDEVVWEGMLDLEPADPSRSQCVF